MFFLRSVFAAMKTIFSSVCFCPPKNAFHLQFEKKSLGLDNFTTTRDFKKNDVVVVVGPVDNVDNSKNPYAAMVLPVDICG
jgi:hypothetical protein